MLRAQKLLAAPLPQNDSKKNTRATIEAYHFLNFGAQDMPFLTPKKLIFGEKKKTADRMVNRSHGG